MSEKNVPQIPEQNEVLSIAEAFEIEEFNTLRLAVERVHSFGPLKEEISETFDEPISAAHKQHKDLLARKKRYMGPVEEAENLYRKKIGDYVAETGETCDSLSVRVEEVPEFTGDIVEIAKLVAKGKLPAKLLKIDSKALKDAAKAGFIDNIPGVKIVEKPVVTIRQRKEKS